MHRSIWLFGLSGLLISTLTACSGQGPAGTATHPSADSQEILQQVARDVTPTYTVTPVAPSTEPFASAYQATTEPVQSAEPEPMDLTETQNDLTGKPSAAASIAEADLGQSAPTGVFDEPDTGLPMPARSKRSSFPAQSSLRTGGPVTTSPLRSHGSGLAFQDVAGDAPTTADEQNEPAGAEPLRVAMDHRPAPAGSPQGNSGGSTLRFRSESHVKFASEGPSSPGDTHRSEHGSQKSQKQGQAQKHDLAQPVEQPTSADPPPRLQPVRVRSVRR